ncbi:MAG: hypothetical protein DRJ69_00385 [Thermoprotei archaeon]|nr:MAG: hypothetical protein DRJ69_00385 [Thermoprotei archaeon]
MIDEAMKDQELESLIKSLEMVYNEACREIDLVRRIITTRNEIDAAQIVRCYNRVQKAVVEVIMSYMWIVESGLSGLPNAATSLLRRLEYQEPGLLNYVYAILKKAGDCFKHDFKWQPEGKPHLKCRYVYSKAIKDRFIDVLEDLVGLPDKINWGNEAPLFPTKVLVLLEKLSELLPKQNGKFGGRRSEGKEAALRAIELTGERPAFLLRELLDESDVILLKGCLERIVNSVVVRLLKGLSGGSRL